MLCTVLKCCHLKITKSPPSLDNANTYSFNQSFTTFFVPESRKKTSEPKTSKPSKRKCPSDAEFQDSPPGSSDDSVSCSKMQEACSSTASSPTLKIKGSNALM